MIELKDVMPIPFLKKEAFFRFLGSNHYTDWQVEKIHFHFVWFYFRCNALWPYKPYPPRTNLE